ACVPIPLFFFLATRPPPRSTLFPYTTLFRSIRARHAAGDAALGRYFLDAIHPFVWRRSLDFGAIGEISAISRRIRDHYAQGQALDRKSTRLNSSHSQISYAVFCLKKKKKKIT